MLKGRGRLSSSNAKYSVFRVRVEDVSINLVAEIRSLRSPQRAASRLHAQRDRSASRNRRD